MLNLFHTLWTAKKSSLIKELKDNKNFWPMLIDPLNHTLNATDDSYAKVFDLITLEILENENSIDENLCKVIQSLFVKDSKFPKKWTEYLKFIMNREKGKLDGDTLLPGIRNVWSWRNLMITCVTRLPEHFSEPQIRLDLTDCCLEGLLCHLTYPEDARILGAFASIYLYLITKWNISCYGNIDDRLLKLSLIYSSFHKHNKSVEAEFKEHLIAIAAKTMQDLAKHVALHSGAVKIFLTPLCDIVYEEYSIMDLRRNGSYFKYNNNWTLLVTFAESLFDTNCAESQAWWFHNSQILEKVLSFISYLLYQQETQNAARVAVRFLVKYANSSLYRDFMYVDLKTFGYWKTIPTFANISSIQFDVSNVYF